MAKYKVNVSSYDIDETDESFDQIPLTLLINVEDNITDVEEIEEILSDEISNETGYCHNGFTYEKAD